LEFGKKEGFIMKNEGESSASPTPFVDNLFAPEFFSIGCSGSLVNQGLIHLTMTSPRDFYNPPGGIANVVNFRIVMPLRGAEEFAHYILDQINRQLDQQIKPGKPPAPSATP